MSDWFDIAFTPNVIAKQEQAGSREHYAFAPSGSIEETPHRLSDDEVGMIQSRDSLYMATVGETGWPYVQHRGGDAGFVKVIDDTTIGWVERTGNRQYVGTGNLAGDGRVALILMDYPTRSRLKVWGRATHHPDPSEELLARLGAEGIRADGAVTIEVVATAWNCPKYITPRYTEAQVEALTRPLTDRIAELEARLAAG
ncbi:MAG: pyridoxamine 5'-phosphate oxidase family protein [Actinomycetota bacterium]